MKRILLFLMLFVSAITFSDTLKNVSYNNGKLIGTFRENKQIIPNASVTKLGNEDVLMLSFSDSQMESSVPAFINRNDQYISKVYTVESNGIVVVYVYLKPSVTYQVTSRSGEFQVALSNGQAAAAQNPRYTAPQRQVNNNSSNARITQAQPQSQPSNISRGNKKYTIVVDPGHGGHDSGARGNGYNEKDIALQVATRLANNLRQDYNVIMTRDSDFFVPLDTRAKIGNDANADFFISIHLNSGGSSANGAEVYYYSKNGSSDYASEVAKFENKVDESYGSSPFSDYVLKDIFYKVNQEKSAEIAESVLDGIINVTGLRRRGVKGANFAVLRGSNSPAILAEIGFISNYSDLSKYLTPEGQENVASAIADAIRRHFR